MAVFLLHFLAWESDNRISQYNENEHEKEEKGGNYES